LTTHERDWRDPVSGWAQGPNSERDLLMSLYGNECRECGFGLRIPYLFDKNWFSPFKLEHTSF
jgi:hypothetical protein